MALIKIIGGALLLSGFYIPVGLVLLSPVVVNILLYHLFLPTAGLGMAVVISALTIFLIWRYWSVFKPILEKKPLQEN